MAQFIFDIPDEQAARIADAVCNRFGGPGESTPTEFTKTIVFRWLRDITLQYEAEMAATAAREAVLDNTNDPLVNANLT